MFELVSEVRLWCTEMFVIIHLIFKVLGISITSSLHLSFAKGFSIMILHLMIVILRFVSINNITSISIKSKWLSHFKCDNPLENIFYSSSFLCIALKTKRLQHLHFSIDSFVNTIFTFTKELHSSHGWHGVTPRLAFNEPKKNIF